MELAELQSIQEYGGTYPRFLRLVADLNVLLLAYNKIKSKPGNMTPGADGKTLDGLSLP
jgi:hypothetical protein